MAVDAKCKICRRFGEKLFLKGERCYSPKCGIVRKPYPPGIHGQARKRRGGSEYATQLMEKQRVRHLYGVSEKQFRNYVESAMRVKGVDVAQKLVETLESRLDNALFRLGYAVSRSVAHQMIGHGHIMINEKPISIPSYRVRPGDKISIRPSSLGKGIFRDLDTTLKKHKAPEWLELNAESREGAVKSLPKVEDVVQSRNIKVIIEYYSR